jgi:sialate O-acetylesterase
MLLALALAAAVLGAASADNFHVSNVFGSHMTLQRNAPIRIWGFGATGCASVTGTLGAARAAGVPGADGVWQLVFPALPASFTPTTFTAACGSATITLTDILVGDVVLCSGEA